MAIYLIIGRILALIATLSIPIFLTRVLTRDDYGLYSQLLVVLAFLSGFFNFGFSLNLFYFYPVAKTKEKGIYVYQTLLLMIALSILMAVSLQFEIIRGILIGSGDLSRHVLSIVVLSALMIPSNMVAPLCVVRNDRIIASIYPFAEVVIRAVFVIIFVSIKPGAQSVFAAMAISSVVVLGWVLKYIIKTIISSPNKFHLSINLEILKAQVKYCLPFGAAITIFTITRMFDKVVCINYLSTSEYAIYAIAFYGAPGIQQIFDSLAQATIVEMTLNFNSKMNDLALIRHKKLIAQSVSISVPVVFVVSLYANSLISVLFSNEYLESAPLMRAYMFTFCFSMFGAGVILRASGKTKYSIYSYLPAAIVTIPVTYYLVKSYGMWGGMVGAILGSTIPKILVFIAELKIMQCGIKNYVPWKSIIYVFLISALLSAPLITINLLWPIKPLWSFVLMLMYLIANSIVQLYCNVYFVDWGQLRNVALRALSLVRI